MDANGLLIDGVIVNTDPGWQAAQPAGAADAGRKGEVENRFRAFARTVKPSWNELLENDAGQGLVRVIVAKDSYYNGPFQDETQWVCYGMASPDTEEIMLGYCRKDSRRPRRWSGSSPIRRLR